jgi:hypothetical protein
MRRQPEEVRVFRGNRRIIPPDSGRVEQIGSNASITSPARWPLLLFPNFYMNSAPLCVAPRPIEFDENGPRNYEFTSTGS